MQKAVQGFQSSGKPEVFGHWKCTKVYKGMEIELLSSGMSVSAQIMSANMSVM